MRTTLVSSLTLTTRPVMYICTFFPLSLRCKRCYDLHQVVLDLHMCRMCEDIVPATSLNGRLDQLGRDSLSE